MSDNEDRFSDDEYQSCSDDDRYNITYNIIKEVFQNDDVAFLKQVILPYMSPEQVYKIMNGGCFAKIYYENAIFYSDSPIRCFKYLVKSGLSINTKDDKLKETPLHHACRNNEKAIFYVLRMGGDPNIRNEADETPIDIYFRKNHSKRFQIDVLKRAIRCGFDIKSRDKKGRSFLHDYYQGCNDNVEEYLSVVEFLINEGFDINIKTIDQTTIINCEDFSHNEKKFTLVKKFYQWGFDFGAKDRNGVNVIDSFIRCDKPRILQLLNELENKDCLSNPKEPDC